MLRDIKQVLMQSRRGYWLNKQSCNSHSTVSFFEKSNFPKATTSCIQYIFTVSWPRQKASVNLKIATFNTFSFLFVFVQSTPFLFCCFSLHSLPLVANSASIFSCSLSRSFSSCSSVKFCRLSLSLSCSFPRCSALKFCLLSLFLSCSLSRCSSVKLRLLSLCSSVKLRVLSLALCRSRSRWAWLTCRLLSRFLCLSLSLYSKLEDIVDKICRKYGCKNNFRQPIRKFFFCSEFISLD